MPSMTNNTAPFDAVTLEVIWRRMISAADEAAKTLQRTSFSTLVNESNDFACVITDADGHSLVQNTESIPSFNSCLPVTVRHFLKEIGRENMNPGDVYICNDPWVGTGHLNDVTVAKPIFSGGKLAAFAASTAHAPDIGGKVRSVVAKEIFEEGFQIPAMKLLDRGEVDRTFIKLLRNQVRTPDQTEGDLWAQMTGLNLMEARVGDLMREYNLPDLTAFGEEIQGRSERAMRAAMAAVPDGRYQASFDTDGFGGKPLHYECVVTVQGNRIHVDFAGTSAQIPRAINCTFTYTFAMVSYALKSALLPDVPNNDGIFRCMEVSAPEGSIVNPKRPVSVGGRMATGHYLPALVFQALAPVLPDKVMAACGSPLWSIIQTGIDKRGRTYANTLFFNGGMGALPTKPGESCYSWPSNISNVPVELVERNTPLFVHSKSLREGSGGAGIHPGGEGQEMVFESESETPIGVIFMAERLTYAAKGLEGGGEGALGEVLIDDQPADVRADHALELGQTITLRTPGGGGYGRI
jgi:N-methylhydantoinase B